MGKPRNVRVTGPLAPYAAGFEEDLAGQGYRSTSDHLYVMAQVSRWLDGRKLGAGDLSATHVEQFLCWRRAIGYGSPPALLQKTSLGGDGPPTPAALAGCGRCLLCSVIGSTSESGRLSNLAARARLSSC